MSCINLFSIRPAIPFHWVILFFLVSGAGISCGSESNSGNTTPQKTTTQQATAADGAAVFRQYCATCHGADGKLGLNGAGDLSKSVLTIEARVTQISKGKNMMPAFEETLSPEEIQAAAKFTLSLKK